MWTWGNNDHGQLGFGDRQKRNSATRLSDEAFVHLKILMAACGENHTLAVTEEGVVFSWGQGALGRLGHGDEEDRLVPTRVDAQHFRQEDRGESRVVVVCAGDGHSCCLTEGGELFSWGMARLDLSDDDLPF